MDTKIPDGATINEDFIIQIKSKYKTEDELKKAWSDYPMAGESWDKFYIPKIDPSTTKTVIDEESKSKNATSTTSTTQREKDYKTFVEEESIFDYSDSEPDEEVLPADKIFKIRSEVNKSNKYSLSEVDFRFILLAGRSRTGKSTCMDILKDPTHIPQKFSIFAGTEKTEFYDFAISGKDENEIKISNVSIKVIDTPGLYEERKMGEAVRTEEQLMGIIGECLEEEIAFLHCIFFFISVESGVNKDDIRAIKELLKMFQTHKVKFALVVTRSERKTPKEKKSILSELRQQEELRNLIAKHRMKLFFSGVCNPANCSSESDLKKIYQSVLKMRNKILKFIFEIEVKERAHLRQMPFIRDRFQKITENMKFVTEKYKWILSKEGVNLNDFEVMKMMKDVEEKVNMIFESSKFQMKMNITNESNFVILNNFHQSQKGIFDSKIGEDNKKMLLGKYYQSFVKK